MKKVLIFMLILLCSFSVFGLLDVHVLDQTTRPLDLFFTQITGNTTGVNHTAFVNDRNIIVLDATDFSVGTYVEIFSNEHHRYYFGDVIAKSGTNLTLDTPLDFDVTVNDNVTPLSRDLNVDGSTTCQTFDIFVPNVDSNLTIDITRLIFSMVMTTAGDDSRFGNILNGLTNGVDLRRIDGITENIFNIKTNGDILNLAFDGDYTDKAGGGNFGFRSRYTLGGQSKHGVTILLEGSDKLDLLICDDLRSLVSFRVIGAGHEVNTTQNNGVEIIREEGFDMLINITIILILLAIGLGFAWFAEKSENFIWYIFGGIWFLVIAPVAVGVLIQINALFSFISIGFFWLIAMMMFWEALDQSMGNSKETE